MDTHAVIFIGGPKHGELEERMGNVFEAPREIRLPTYISVLQKKGFVVYRRRALADTPGRIAYVYGGTA